MDTSNSKIIQKIEGKYKLRQISPFEGQPLLRFFIIVEIILVFLMIYFSGFIKIIAIILSIPVILFILSIIYMRLSSKWRGIHYPLSVIYARTLGYAQSQENLSIEDKMDIALLNVLNNLYPDIKKEDLTEYYEAIISQLPDFMNELMIKDIFKKNASNITEEESTKVSKYLADKLANEKFKKVWLVYSNVIQSKFGVDEKYKYLFAVIKGKAT